MATAGDVTSRLAEAFTEERRRTETAERERDEARRERDGWRAVVEAVRQENRCFADNGHGIRTYRALSTELLYHLPDCPDAEAVREKARELGIIGQAAQTTQEGDDGNDRDLLALRAQRAEWERLRAEQEAPQ